jgi:hypothetical protein
MRSNGPVGLSIRVRDQAAQGVNQGRSESSSGLLSEQLRAAG